MPINSPNVYDVVGDAFLTGIGGGTGTLSYQLDEYDISGTWTMPANCIGVEVWLMEGASGGGSGMRKATNVLARGGYAGLNGVQMFAFFLPQQISNSVPIIVGAGGTGGASVTTDDTNGTAGTSGGGTYFGTFLGSEGAPPFDNANETIPVNFGNSFPIKSLESQWWGQPPTFSSGYVFGNQVLNPSNAKIFGSGNNATSTVQMTATGLGSISSSPRGAQITAANVASVGITGGPGYNYYDSVTIYAGASAPTGLGDNGINGLDNYTEMYNCGMIMLCTNNKGTFKTGQSPSSGSSSLTANGGNGGNGGKYGIAGAGGGASRNGFNSGAGGAGAQGCVKVLSIILN